MDKEYYTSKEYKKVDEYKKMPAEDYRSRREFFGNKRELAIIPEDNHDAISNKLKEAKKAAPKADDNGLKKILDKITTTSTSVVTSTAVVVAGAGAVAVAPNIIPDLPPIIPDVIPVVDLATGVIEIIDEEEYVYNGSEIKPNIRLLIAGAELDSSKYQVEYLNNINPGIATIKITPINDEYKGEISLDFIILKDENDINIRYVDGEIVITSKYSSGILKYYSDSECKVEIEKPEAPGSYFVRAYIPEGDNHKEAYSNILSYIVPYSLMDASIRLKSNDLIYYTGAEIKPEFDLLLDDNLIDANSYNVEYVDNINPGKGKIIVSSNSEEYKDTIELEFIINKRINKVEIKYLNNEIVIESLYGDGVLKYYSDIECRNEIEKPTTYGHYFVRAYVMEDEYNNECVSNVLEYNINLDLSDTTLEIINLEEYRYTGNEIKPEIKALYNGLVVDPSLYKIEYLNNTLPGKATININLVDGESIGTNLIEFTILKAENAISINKVGSEYKLTASHGTGTLKYYSDAECTLPIDKPTKYGHYFVRGEVLEDETHLGAVSEVLAYDIPLNLADCVVSIVNLEEYRYTGSSISPTVEVKLGTEVIDSTLYTVEYLNNTMPGTATININLVDGESIGTNKVEFTILKAENAISINKVGSEYQLTASHGTGVLKYYSDLECTIPIDKPTKYGHYFVRGEVAEDETHLGAVSEALAYDISLNLADCVVSIVNLEEYRYTGSAIAPTVEVKLGTEVIDSTLYSVEYLNNTMPGTATIKISLVEGESIGTNKVEFTILKAENRVDITGSGDSITATASHGEAVLKYYLDELCTSPLATKPTAHGHYFVRGEVAEDETHLASVSQALAYDIPINLSDTVISITDTSEIRYIGSEIKPTIEVKLALEVIDSTLYTITYIDNIMPGMATIKVTPVNSECIGEISTTFEILKAINNVGISYQGSEIIIEALHGTGELKYYSDEACNTLITKPVDPGFYFVRCEIPEDETHLAGVSNVLEYNIDAKVIENELRIGNEIVDISLNLKGVAGLSYKLEVKDDKGIVVKTLDAVEGDNRFIIEGLTISKAYTIILSSNDSHGYKIYYTKNITTLDGTKAIAFVRSISSVKSSGGFESNIAYDFIVDDPNKLYASYVINIESVDNTATMHTLKGEIEYFYPGDISIGIAGEIDVDPYEVPIYDFTYKHKSAIPAPTSFTRAYTKPANTSKVTYEVGSSDVTVNIDLGFTDYDDYSYIEATLIDQDGNKYTSDFYSADDRIYYVPLTVESFTVELCEITSYDNIKYPFARYTIPGKVVLKEGISTKSIRADKSKGKLDIDFNINMKPDSKAILKNVTANTTEIITANMSVALPDVLTAYEYYLEDSGGLQLTTPVSFTVDPTKYNVAMPETFIPVEPRDVIKTFNSDNTWNMYMYTGFKSTNPNLSYTARLFNDNYNEYYNSKLEYLEVLNLKGEFGIEYFIGEEYNGVYYVCDSYKMNLDTMTNKDIYSGFVTNSYNELTNETTISLRLKDLNVIYDLNNIMLKYGLYDTPTIVTLNQADFTYDSVLGAYCKDVVFIGTTTWWELSMMANSNIKNLDKVEALTTIKGNKYTKVDLQSF